jgi:hypothetical protein
MSKQQITMFLNILNIISLLAVAIFTHASGTKYEDNKEMKEYQELYLKTCKQLKAELLEVQGE